MKWMKPRWMYCGCIMDKGWNTEVSHPCIHIPSANSSTTEGRRETSSEHCHCWSDWQLWRPKRPSPPWPSLPRLPRSPHGKNPPLSAICRHQLNFLVVRFSATSSWLCPLSPLLPLAQPGASLSSLRWGLNWLVPYVSKRARFIVLCDNASVSFNWDCQLRTG